MPEKIGLGLIRLAGLLPLRLLAPLGQGFGMLLYWLAWERRRVVRINLRMCFPTMPDKAREKLSRRHFRAFGRTVLEHSILWWGSERRIRNLVVFEGRDNLDRAHGKPLITFQAVDRGIEGMCLDSDGNIIACAGWKKSGVGPMLYVISPSGTIIESHPAPADMPMRCAFGDAGLGSLYVTAGDGMLYRAKNTGRKGLSR